MQVHDGEWNQSVSGWTMGFSWIFTIKDWGWTWFTVMVYSIYQKWGHLVRSCSCRENLHRKLVNFLINSHFFRIYKWNLNVRAQTHTQLYIYISIYLYIYISIYLYLYLYLCTYVRMYARTYVCMHVCMYVCRYVCMYVCTVMICNVM